MRTRTWATAPNSMRPRAPSCPPPAHGISENEPSTHNDRDEPPCFPAYTQRACSRQSVGSPMRRLFKGVGLGAIVALIGIGAAVLAADVEEEFGLAWLFELRGPVAPPDDVAIVAIDQESARALGLPAAPREWPRELHARGARARGSGRAADRVRSEVRHCGPGPGPGRAARPCNSRCAQRRARGVAAQGIGSTQGCQRQDRGYGSGRSCATPDRCLA
jgi:hypothetical protein